MTARLYRDAVTDCMIVDGSAAVETEQEVIDAYQRLIDSGIVWQLQGTFGRTAANLIDNGICRPSKGG